MSEDDSPKADVTRREVLATVGRLAAASVVLGPALETTVGAALQVAAPPPLNAMAGVDRITVLPARTYLNGWAGYGEPPQRQRRRPGQQPAAAPEPPGPAPRTRWVKRSGPGTVTFADAAAPVTTATFSAPGAYVLELTVENGATTASSAIAVNVEASALPASPLQPIHTMSQVVDNPLWTHRLKALIVNWIPHCVNQINRTDLEQGPGGIDNFVEAAKALARQPHGPHKGYVFSNAWVHQTVEAMSLALMVDAKGDQEILRAQATFRATLEDWIPKILAAQEPDGYLQTAFTLREPAKWAERWSAPARANHEGYVAGYFIEAAINHYLMTGKKDARLYGAAKKLADCWCDHLGPAPKKDWFDGHQEMEQALVRFGRFVNEVEGGGRGDRYVGLARFLLDARRGGTEYDQSHLPVVQQYEAVGHAVRAVYTYSGMADIVLATRDAGYESAARSIWDNIVNRKYYVTGGIGSGETSEGFGPDYSLRNEAYCETCSSCGQIFFQWKMNLAYRDARYADLYEETLYNALLGSLDLEARTFYYDNPLDANVPRAPWHNCPCCVGNLARTLLMLPTWTYAKAADAIYVNLFVGGACTVEGVAGTDVEMSQATRYPWDGKVSLTVRPRAPRPFTVAIRVPNRQVSALYSSTPRVEGLTSIAVNGSPVKAKMEKGYALITRAWRAGDRIDLVLPMGVQRVRGIEEIAATRGRVALRYGPLVYNIEKADQDIARPLAPGAPLTTEWKPDLLGGVVVIKGAFADGTPMLAIPNYARYNRGPVAEPQPPRPPAASGAPAPRPPRPPAASIVWIRESSE